MTAGILLLATHAAAGPSLVAEVGLGGLVRASRWTPIQITISSTDPNTTGDLVLTWGDATVRRRIAFDAPGTRRIDFHMRTSEPRSRLQLVYAGPSGDGPVLEIPARVLRDDEPLNVCVVPDAATAAAGAACTVTLTPATLPRSARGYEAADAVSWPAGRVALDADRQAALDQWDTLKRLDASGALSLTPQAARPVVARGLPAATARGLLVITLAYGVLLALLARACARHRLPVRYAGAGLAAAVAAGCGLVLGLGQFGSLRAVTVHHRSVMLQVPGAGVSLLSIRAIAEFPARDTAALRLPVADGNLEASLASGRGETVIDADGFPVLTGPVELAARRGFGVEAMVPLRVLEVDEGPEQIRITNQSPYPLDACQMASGLSPASVERLAAGASITVTQPRSVSGDDLQEAAIVGPLVTCTFSGAAVSLADARRPVRMNGTTLVAAYSTRPPAVPESESEVEPRQEAP